MEFLLRELIIELTTYCPMKCIHCYNTEFIKRRHMPLDSVKRIIDEAFDMSVLKLTFTGGEILTYPYLLEVLTYARSKGFCVNVLTTLYSSNFKTIEKMASISHQIGVSLYGHTPTVHESITKIKGSFDIIKENITRVLTINSNVSINVTLMKSNIKYWKKIREFVEKNFKIKCTLGLRIFDTVCNKKSNSQLWADEKQCIDFFTESKSVQFDLTRKLHYVCGAGRNQLWISVDFNVLPCVFFSHPISNLKNHTLKGIWNSNPFLLQLRAVKASDFNKCESCDKQSFCQPCVGDNYAKNGNITLPSQQNCYMADLTFKAANLINKHR